MIMKGLVTIPALAIFGGLSLRAGSLQVTAVRTWSFPDITRVAIEVNGDFRYRVDRAHNPERLFFDLIGAVPRIDGRRIMRKEIGNRLVKSVRVAETEPGTTRIVLDLEGPVEYTASQLSSPDRLVVELRAGSVPAPPALISSTPRAAEAEDMAERPMAQLVAKQAPPRDIPAEAKTSPALAKAETLKQPPLADPPKITANARSANIDVTHSLTRALGLKINRVVIDAGHGGHDQGTTGESGLLEKDLVLDVALRLGKLVQQRMGAEVIYTRSDDTFVPLEERTAIANRSHADLFLSIHANSSPAHEVAGVETYYLNFTNSADAMNVAARENASSDKSVYELKDLIQKISLHDKIEESKEFADCIQTSMQNFNAKSFPSAHNRGVRKAPFVVLIGASMPSVLAEVGFLTNSRQEALLKRPEYRQKLAEALYRGLQRYNQTLSHFEVAKQTAASPVADRDSR